MHQYHYLACDLGAESGRVMLGSLDDGRLELTEIHRFANHPVGVLDSLYWNVLALWQEIKHGLGQVAAAHGRQLDGIAVDSWAQDFGLVDARGDLLGLPHTYRDRRTRGILGVLRRSASDWELYQRTGLAGLEISTLGQLLAMRAQGSPALGAAQALLFMPGLFTFWLSGQQANDASMAGISQMCNLSTGDWDREMLERVQLPPTLPAPVVPTATPAGSLLKSVAQEVGLDPAPVIVTAGHDTAAAVAALPERPIRGTEADGQKTVTFISCATWSVVGRELNRPLITRQAMERRFLNEVGACRRTLLAYNSAGLWPVQQWRRTWQRVGRDWSYPELTGLAHRALPFAALVDPDDPVFAQAGDALEQLATFCRRTRQPIPETPGSVVRAFLESLALRYRKGVEDLAALTGRAAGAVHLIGGGSRNELLCQLTADAARCPVLAGPAEATAIGTLLLQALARGRMSSLSQAREVVARSCRLVSYEPAGPAAAWDERYAAFQRLGG